MTYVTCPRCRGRSVFHRKPDPYDACYVCLGTGVITTTHPQYLGGDTDDSERTLPR